LVVGKANQQEEEGVCYIVALPFPFKNNLGQKRTTMETQIFHHAKII
jgi:hypothetical protein